MVGAGRTVRLVCSPLVVSVMMTRPGVCSTIVVVLPRLHLTGVEDLIVLDRARHPVGAGCQVHHHHRRAGCHRVDLRRRLRAQHSSQAGGGRAALPGRTADDDLGLRGEVVCATVGDLGALEQALTAKLPTATPPSRRRGRRSGAWPSSLAGVRSFGGGLLGARAVGRVGRAVRGGHARRAPERGRAAGRLLGRPGHRAGRPRAARGRWRPWSDASASSRWPS